MCLEKYIYNENLLCVQSTQAPKRQPTAVLHDWLPELFTFPISHCWEQVVRLYLCIRCDWIIQYRDEAGLIIFRTGHCSGLVFCQIRRCAQNSDTRRSACNWPRRGRSFLSFPHSKKSRTILGVRLMHAFNSGWKQSIEHSCIYSRLDRRHPLWNKEEYRVKSAVGWNWIHGIDCC